MKKSKTILLLFCFILINKSFSQIYPQTFLNNGCYYTYNGLTYTSSDSIHCKGSNYTLIFEDDFNGTALDTTKWITSYPFGRSLWNTTSGTGWEREYYSDSNVYVQNGLLHLVTKIDPGYRSPDPNNLSNIVYFKYTSGMVCAKQMFSEGKFEIKAKIPYIDGTWPAFWISGACSQEIDGFEFLNTSQKSDATEDSGNMVMTYHKKNNCNEPELGQCDNGLSRNAGKNLSNDFHIYTFEWDENKIIWKVDDEIFREVYRIWNISPPFPVGPLYGNATPIKNCNDLTNASQYTVFNTFPTKDILMNFVLNTAVAFDRGNYPTEFLIDYVKIYTPSDTIIDPVNFSLINIYPNPTSGRFSIYQSNNNDPIDHIFVLNSLGEVIQENKVITPGVCTIDFINQSKGLYIVKVVTTTSTSYRKIIIN